jgi:hypothetical protein
MRNPDKKKKRMTPNCPKKIIRDFDVGWASGQEWARSTEMIATPRSTSRLARLLPRDGWSRIRLQPVFRQFWTFWQSQRAMADRPHTIYAKIARSNSIKER